MMKGCMETVFRIPGLTGLGGATLPCPSVSLLLPGGLVWLAVGIDIPPKYPLVGKLHSSSGRFSICKLFPPH